VNRLFLGAAIVSLLLFLLLLYRALLGLAFIALLFALVFTATGLGSDGIQDLVGHVPTATRSFKVETRE